MYESVRKRKKASERASSHVIEIIRKAEYLKTGILRSFRILNSK